MRWRDWCGSSELRSIFNVDLIMTAWRSKHVVFYDHSVIYYLIILYTVALTSFIRYIILKRFLMHSLKYIVTIKPKCVLSSRNYLLNLSTDLNGGDYVVRGVGLRPLDCWDCGFETCRGHGCSSIMFVVCCVGSVLCDELITHSGESYSVCVCVCVCVWYRNLNHKAA